MILLFASLVHAHSLFLGPDTFKYKYELLKPKRMRKSTSLWGEHFAAEAASQIAMWIHVSSSDFPALEWATLESNVLAHYVDHPYHIMLVITLYPILKASLTRVFTDVSTSYITMGFLQNHTN